MKMLLFFSIFSTHAAAAIRTIPRMGAISVPMCINAHENEL